MEKEFIIEKQHSITLNVTAGQIDSYRELEKTTGTVRVYENGCIGVAGCLGEPDEEALTAQAKEALMAPSFTQAFLFISASPSSEAASAFPQIPPMQRDEEPVATLCAALLVTAVSVTLTAFPTMPPMLPEAFPL